MDLLPAFLTVFSAIFIAELTDKDALLLLTLATRVKPQLAFAAGSIAFTITSAIIVTIGSILTAILPVYWVKIGGGVVMICFAIYEFFEITKEAKKIESEENAKLDHGQQKKNSKSILLSSIAMLVALDLAGDATEVLTIVFVAKFQDALLVFVACVAALVLASGVETVIGHRLGKFLTPGRVRYLSLFVFLSIGLVIIISTVLFP